MRRATPQRNRRQFLERDGLLPLRWHCVGGWLTPLCFVRHQSQRGKNLIPLDMTNLWRGTENV